MRYLSLCSGIEAASVAWAPLGWTPVAFAEIEAFPSAVLKHHHPDVPNLGDITRFQEWPDLGTVDLVCGGTPCQSFSVAGLRKGLADPRGNLALTFLAIVDRYRPRVVVWENVPGVLSANEGRDLAAFLGGLGQLGYGWAFRVLDAQFTRVDGFPHAVPQRRRRLFVVGYLGNWACAAAILSEPEGLLGYTAPRRQAGQGTSPTIAGCSNGGGANGPGRDVDSVESLQVVMSSGQANAEIRQDGGAPALTCLHEAPVVAHTLRADGFDASEDGTGRGPPLLPVAIQERAICENPDAGPDGAGVREDGASYTLEARQVPQAVAFQPRYARNGRGAPDVVAAALTSEPGRTGKGDSAQCVAFDTTQITSAANRSQPKAGDPCHTLAGAAHPPAIAMPAVASSIMANEARTYTNEGWAVRRLMPVECERLMGFPDGYTAITYRGKPAADGPRYKALGNSWAVNCARWIGRRIQMVEELVEELKRENAA